MTQTDTRVSAPERWRQVKEILLLAVDCESSAHPSLLAAKCGGDTDLRAEVESLVAVHQRLSGVAESPGARSNLLPLDFRGNDRFTVGAQIGVGGFGVVYRAFDQKLRQWVALKVLRKPDAESLVQFKREFRSVSRLHLPNLVRCYELFSDEQSLFFSMELVDGLPLLDYLHAAPECEGAECPHRRLVAVFSQLTRGVLDLHAAGWLHRDLKPSNVLVDRSGRAVILDLGLVRSVDDPQHSAHLFGSPYYVAPELFSRARPTEASDWYSVGVMLYEGLTGRVPWTSSWLDLVNEKVSGEPPSPRNVKSDVPAHLDALCSALLSREPIQRPNGAEVLRCLGDGFVTVARDDFLRPETVATPFVGRVSYLATLRDALTPCTSGHPSVVEVVGTSGIGKTALVHRFLDLLREEHGDANPIVVLEGRCYQQESIRYKVFDGVIEGLCLYLKRLPPARIEALLPRNLAALIKVFPSLQQAAATSHARRRVFAGEAMDGLELRRKAFGALRELLGRIAERHLLVIFVDDLHWGDRDSAALLQHLLSSEEAPPLLLLLAYRSELTDSPVLHELLLALPSDEVARRRLLLKELEPAEGRSFAAAVLGEQHPAIPTIVREAGGIPCFLDELVGQVRCKKAGAVDTAPRQLRLDQLLLERINHLPADARRLLDVISIARKPLALETAQVAAGYGACGSAMVELLYDGRLARPVGSGASIEPCHDRIREVAEAALSPAYSIDLHRRLAVALEAHACGDAEQLAVHFQAAGDHESAVHYATVAAQEAVAAAAFNRAVRLYQMAIELTGDRSADTAVLLAKLGDAQANAGLGRKAADSYSAAARLDGANSQELRRKAAEQLMRVGEIDEGQSVMDLMMPSLSWRKDTSGPTMVAKSVMRRALLRLRGLGFSPRAEHEIPQDLLLRTDLAWTAFLGHSVVDPVRAAYIQSYHIVDALKTGDPGRIVRALATEAALAGMWGEGSRYQSLMEALNRTSDLVSGQGERHWPSFSRTIAAYHLDRWTECQQQGEATEQALLENGKGTSWELSVVRAFAIAATIVTGELHKSQRKLHELLRDCDERGDFFSRACLTLLGQSRILRFAQDQPKVAEVELQELRQRWPAVRFPRMEENAGAALAEISLYTGRVVEARIFFASGISSSARAFLGVVPTVRIAHRYLRARVAIALAQSEPPQRESLLRIAAAEARALQTEKRACAAGFAHLIRAAIASLRGARVGAIEALTSAEERLDCAGLRMHAMLARLARGQLTSGEDGMALVQEGESWAAQQCVQQPYRMIATFLPGVLQAPI